MRLTKSKYLSFVHNQNPNGLSGAPWLPWLPVFCGDGPLESSAKAAARLFGASFFRAAASRRQPRHQLRALASRSGGGRKRWGKKASLWSISWSGSLLLGHALIVSWNLMSLGFWERICSPCSPNSSARTTCFSPWRWGTFWLIFFLVR